MTAPSWLTLARTFEGQKEVPGPASNPWILSLWTPVGWIWKTVARKDDSLLPWCGAFVRHCLVTSGYGAPKNWFRAREYVAYGEKLERPVVGAIGVILNGKQWHVGFIEGVTSSGSIVMRGGNQNDSVKLSAFKPSLFKAFRWVPGGAEYDSRLEKLPVIDVSLSTSQV